MAIQKTTFRARTRGRNPKEFSYVGVGKPVARQVQDKDSNPIVLDAAGNQVEYKYEKTDGKYSVSAPLSVDEKGNLVLPEGFSFVVVDDADVESILLKTDAEGKSIPLSEDEVSALIPEIVRDLFDRSVRKAVIGMLQYYNELRRDEAAPKTEKPEDVLSPVIAAIRSAGLVAADWDESKWRRSVSMGAEAAGKPKLEFALTMSALGKKVADKVAAAAA